VYAPNELRVGKQDELFGAVLPGDEETGSVLMHWDRMPEQAASPDRQLPANAAALLEQISQQGLKAYPKNPQLRAAPAALQQETRPMLAQMADVSRHAASQLPLDEVVIAGAVRAARHALREKEIHTELTGNTRREQDVEIVTDRAALLREAESCLRRIPQVEDEDVRLIVNTLAQRVLPHMATAEEGTANRADEKQLLRLARDAACWIIRKQAQALTEAVLDAVATFATVDDAKPLPDAMLYPLAHALLPSPKNLYGVVPPLKDDVAAQCTGLSIDAQTLLQVATHRHAGGQLSTATFDGASAINLEERAFIKTLDRDDAVLWWHRNPDRKPWSVRLVRSEHGNYFYPDFVVCLSYPQGAAAMTRLIETKESTKDAARKARRVPKIYGKVMFVTKDNDNLRIVNDDGSLGAAFDWGDLTPAWDWLAAHCP